MLRKVRLRERKQLGSIYAAVTILPQGQDRAVINWSLQANLFGTVNKYLHVLDTNSGVRSRWVFKCPSCSKDRNFACIQSATSAFVDFILRRRPLAGSRHNFSH